MGVVDLERTSGIYLLAFIATAVDNRKTEITGVDSGGQTCS
ncbi:hypothetical protein SAMN05216285_1817 [Natrinema salifodinae]|uniref:Uncharacterized protein n=1 Tax=Natrinema salifodinae TaxID=1202768 RepID=A0A1I0NJL1_9EURY|nr:hypothetical protein SAMN05216285_1817 [Natrinema salifodinae]